MKWKKKGLLFCPYRNNEWMYSYAAVPIADNIGGDFFKIYFSSRDKNNRSFTSFVVINITRPNEIIDMSLEPILCPGELGGFDDSGAMATWLVNFSNKKYLYYIGWNLGVTVPFRNSIGLAIGASDNDFSRAFKGPILDRTAKEPHFCASCCVLVVNNIWRMWYLSCTDWYYKNEKVEHRYHIKYAESANGVDWVRDGHIAIDYKNEFEYAISRPSVIYENGVWKMWFSCRGNSYRIGYAESKDGKNWKRLDRLAGIDVSPSGWDSDMIEYPFVFRHKNNLYMLYNGNDYGKTGFGLAVLEKD